VNPPISIDILVIYIKQEKPTLEEEIELQRKYDEILEAEYGLSVEPPEEPHIQYQPEWLLLQNELYHDAVTYYVDQGNAFPDGNIIDVYDVEDNEVPFLFPRHSVEDIYNNMNHIQRAACLGELKRVRHHSTAHNYMSQFNRYNFLLDGVDDTVKMRAINTDVLVLHTRESAKEHLMNAHSPDLDDRARAESLEAYIALEMNPSIAAYRLYDFDAIKCVFFIAGIPDLDSDMITPRITIH